MALVHCRECGEMISESAPTCPKCGAKQNSVQQGNENFFDKFKPGNVGLKVLSVLACPPIVGLILFLANYNKKRAEAISYLLWSIAGFIIGLLINYLFRGAFWGTYRGF